MGFRPTQARVAGGLLCALLLASPAGADESDALETHAFVSQGFIKSSANNYLARSERGSFEFTEVGINFTSRPADRLRIGMQLFARDLGPLGSYTPTLDWFYLDYRFADWFGLRAGRSKIPFGLYNDSADIDAAHVPILLPQSVYPADHRDYLLAQIGLEAYGSHRFDTVGALEYRVYGGTLDLGVPVPPGPGVTVENLNIPYVLGGRLMWRTPLDGLSAAGSYQALRFDWNYELAPELVAPLQAFELLPMDFTGTTLPVKFNVNLWVASLQYLIGDLNLSAEYSRWLGRFDSVAPALLPVRTENERYYAMASYRVAPWFVPGAYYSVYYPSVDRRRGRDAYQRDAALSWRFDLNDNWMTKLEGHWIVGTAALEPALNGGLEPTELERAWGVFLVKTTAYF
jgi:hypothetical protein